MSEKLDFAMAAPSEIDEIATEICGHDAVRTFITDAEQMCSLHGVIQEVLASRPPPPAVEGGWRDVLAERERQKTVKGWTSEHDDDHDNGELVHAEWGAMGRLKQAASLIGLYSPVPAEARKLLVESAALILAEVERIDRATVSTDLREPWRDFRSYSTNERLLAEFKWTDGRVAVGQWSAHGYWMRHVGGTMRQETINRKFETVTYDVMTVVLAKAPDGVYPTDWRPLPTPPAGEKP